MRNSETCLPDLFPEHLLIEGDDQHVIQVDPLAGMGKNTDEIVEVIGLMKLEKVIGESKGLEGQICVFLVRIARREIQRVVADREAGAGGDRDPANGANGPRPQLEEATGKGNPLHHPRNKYTPETAVVRP